ncbi:MAG TPA: MBL fold metallo-hydrolase [Casimicrobiaceae bacterium]|nr:MBL fold metallo-hydrolase [Casimicrobiaceae bacterium]
MLSIARFAALLLVLAPPMSTPVRAADDIVLEPQRVSAHGYFVQGEAGMASAANKGFMSNAGFVVTGEGVVVFDALGTPALGRALVAAIRTVTPAPIRRVIVSHYHADHVYGLQPLKAAGAEICAYRAGEAYFTSGLAEERLAQRRADLFPWVDETTHVVHPDLWLDGDTDFRLGGLTFRLVWSGGGHSPEDLMMYIVEDRLLFAGDLIFAGRIPFVGNGDSKGWLAATQKMLALSPSVVVPGHGPASHDVARDLVLTRDYLVYMRETMGRAVHDLTPFDEAYAATDWSRYKALPAFEPANRINAWGTYLRMEQEELEAVK